jgi:hypothetical protein
VTLADVKARQKKTRNKKNLQNKNHPKNSVLGKDKGYREKETAKKSSKMPPLPLPKVFSRKLFIINCCFSLRYETTQKKSFLNLKIYSRFFL